MVMVGGKWDGFVLGLPSPLSPTPAPRPGPCVAARALTGLRTNGSQAARFAPRGERGFKAAVAQIASTCSDQSPSPLAGEGLGRGGKLRSTHSIQPPINHQS